MKYTLSLLLVAVGSPHAYPANCHQFFQKVQVVQQVQKVIVPAVAVSPYIYQAGRDIEADALAAKVAALVTQQLLAQPLTQPQTAPASAIAQHCAKCHSGATPKGGLTLDGVTPLLCSQITASLRQIASDEMPKDHKLPPELKGQIMSELLALERKELP